MQTASITRSLWLIALLAVGVGVNAPFWAYDASEQDVYYTWLEGHRLIQGENPYARVLEGDMLQNDKYATYFPGFYLLAAATEAIGFAEFDSWVLFWRPVFLLCNLAIAALLLIYFARRNHLAIGVFAALFWLLNRWTLYVSRIAHIEFIPILLLLLSLLLFARRRRTSLILLSAGLAIKQMAIILIPLYLIWSWRTTAGSKLRDSVVTLLWIGSIPLVLSLPFLFWNAEAFFKSIMFSATTAPEGHIQGLQSLDVLIGMKMPGFVGIPAKLPMLCLMAAVWWATWRRDIGVLTGSLFAFLVFVSFNSVLYMQYLCWPLALLPLALGECMERRSSTAEEPGRVGPVATMVAHRHESHPVDRRASSPVRHGVR